jgi:hypothetical protein
VLNVLDVLAEKRGAISVRGRRKKEEERCCG